MPRQPKIVAFAGSLREHSFNKRVLKTAMAGAANAGADVTYLDLRDFPLPIYDDDLKERDGFPQAATDLQMILKAHDGLLIASPEYNGSVPGGLKNMLDWTSRPHGYLQTGEVFKGKVSAIMTASPGAFGGIRCLNHLRGVLSILLVNVLPSEIAVGKVNTMFEGDNEIMTDEKMKKILEDHGASLADMLKKTHGKIEVVQPES